MEEYKYFFKPQDNATIIDNDTKKYINDTVA
jgi:hypothetical protein